MNRHSAQAEAQTRTALGNLRSKTDATTKRMAGAALAGMLGPGIVSSLDSQDNTLLNDVLGVAITGTGAGLGGYLGYQQNTIPADQIESYKREQMSAFKDEVRELMHTDPEAARDKLAALKGAMIDDVTPIDPKRAAVLNSVLRQSEITEPLAELDMLNKTPRQLRGLSRGVAIGALTAAIPAYMMHARGEGQ